MKRKLMEKEMSVWHLSNANEAEMIGGHPVSIPTRSVREEKKRCDGRLFRAKKKTGQREKKELVERLRRRRSDRVGR